MPEPHSIVPFDCAAVVDHARALWRDASARARTCRVELYAKVSDRTRIERGDPITRSSSRHALETGLAIRALTSLEDGAGFASAAGFSREVSAWVLDRAIERGSRVSADSPDFSTTVQSERLDLDPADAFPSKVELMDALERNPALEWFESGTTMEVLVGGSGWHAVRRRQRVWAMIHGTRTKLIAQRGLNGWPQWLERVASESHSAELTSPWPITSVVFLPDAASPIVDALAATFHTGNSKSKVMAGVGWTLDDDPLRADGLAGGAFDDAGYPSERRALAAQGRMEGEIWGPGSLRRRSYRTPPEPSSTNLTMPSGASNRGFGGCSVVESTRVVRIRSNLWVLELEFVPAPGQPRTTGSRGYVRLSPRELLERCTTTIGPQRVTAAGPIVPALRFDGLPLALQG